MKKLEFKTSKGSFMLVDSTEIEGIKLSEITEEQSSKIVDLFNLYPKNYYQDYERFECGYSSSIESLHSLLKSKGVYLYENPVPTPEYVIDNFGNGGVCENWVKEYQEAEQKTFYNPVIFKL